MKGTMICMPHLEHSTDDWFAVLLGMTNYNDL